VITSRQVECTINEFGDRAGDAARGEFLMAPKARQDFHGLTTNFKTERLYSSSRMVSTVIGPKAWLNEAIVEQDAFAHEAGIQQEGILKERLTYEILRLEEVGVPKADLVLRKHSGRHALRDRVTDLGYRPSDEQHEAPFHDFKAPTDKKKVVDDEDLAVLVEESILDAPRTGSSSRGIRRPTRA
jgi:2-isopropylmalate synthase